MTLECRIATPSDVVQCIASIAHRIIDEERLTREQFGATYDAYAESVRAFVSGLIGWLGPHVFEIGGPRPCDTDHIEATGTRTRPVVANLPLT
jgi:hypothetical protein